MTNGVGNPALERFDARVEVVDRLLQIGNDNLVEGLSEVLLEHCPHIDQMVAVTGKRLKLLDFFTRRRLSLRTIAAAVRSASWRRDDRSWRTVVSTSHSGGCGPVVPRERHTGLGKRMAQQPVMHLSPP